MKVEMKYVLGVFCLLLFASCAKPIAKFSIASQEKMEAPALIKFKNESKKSDKYIWDFGDGSTSEDFSPNHQYVLSGKYIIKLTAIKGDKKDMQEQEIFIEAPEICSVKMETSLGNIVIQLDNRTPNHRDNFIELVESGFYEELLFHRVINGFMIQGGDPDSKGAKKGARLGSGGPGYQVPAEFNDDLAHVKGAIAAARQGDRVNPEKRSSGSQFYIVHGGPVSEETLDRNEAQKGIVYSDEVRANYLKNGGTPFLDAGYTVFGMVTEGMEVIDAIAKVATDPGDRPLEDVKIISVKLIK